MAAVGVTLLVIVAVIAFSNRERIVNLALERLAKDYRVTLESIDFSESGKVEISGLYLTPKDAPANARATRVEKLEVTYDFDELRKSRKVRTITMVKPTILVDDRTLKAFGLSGESDDEEETTAAVDLSFLGAFADSFIVRDGQFELNVSNAPPTAFAWEFETGGIDMASSEWMTEEPMMLRFSNIEIGSNAGLGTIEGITLGIHLSPDFRRILIEEAGVVSPKVKITPEWFPRTDAKEKSGDGTVDQVVKIKSERPDADGSTQGQGAWLIVKRVFLQGGEFAVEGFPQVPGISFGTEFDWSDFRWGDGMFYAGELLELKLQDITVGDGLGAAQSLELRAEWLDLFELNRVKSILIREPRVVISNKTMAVFEGEETEVKTNQDTDEADVGRPFLVDRFEIWDGEFLLEELGQNGPRISAGVNGNFAGISLGGGQFSADGDQRLWVDEFSMWGPNAAEELPLVSFPAGRVEFVLSDLLDGKKVESLAIVRPVVEMTDASLGDWATQKEAGSPQVEAKEPEASIQDSPKPKGLDGDTTFWSINDLRITDGRLNVETSIGGGKVPMLEGAFTVSSEAEVSDTTDDPGYRAVFSDVRLRDQVLTGIPKSEKAGETGGPRLGGLFPGAPEPEPVAREQEAVLIPGISARDVAFVKEFTIDVTAAGIQRDRHIERVQVSGGMVKIGEGLKAMAGDDSEEAGTDEEEEGENVPQPLQQDDVEPEREGNANAASPSGGENIHVGQNGWKIGELQVTESRVLFESLIPQIEGLEFAIETSLQEVVLSGQGLLNNRKLQKIELTGIEIMDPYDGFIRVAELPTVFVEFTLAGLMNQEIEKIDLLGPNLYVGQGLFWWVDYQKKYRAQNEGAKVELEGKPGNVDVAVDPVADAPSWAIKTINAHYGKIIIAPVGYPVGIVPFPFEASTNMEKGEIALKLEIPDEQYVYEFPSFKVQLFGLSGNIDFNVPIQQKDNNLVQVFRLKRAVWKQYEAEDVFLDVTYDANGIYGKFGGNAYAGYLNGQFNVYLNETGKWDAWMAGTGMDTGPLTQTIAPEQFFMEGKVNAKIVSEGVGLEFGETSGDFQILEPGRFNVTKLDDMLKSLPDEWSVLQRSLTELGIETLKEFNYESGGGELYFLNRDGWLQLNLKGETGKREVNINVHDWRGAASDSGPVAKRKTVD